MVILVGTLSVGACAFSEPEIQDLVEINMASGGLTKQATIDARSMEKIKNDINSMSDVEKTVEILDCIGVELDRENPMVMDLSKNLYNIVSIRSEKQIIEISPNGSQRIITEREYKDIEEKSDQEVFAVRTNATTSHDHTSESQNGYMEQTISAIYYSSPEGTYRIIAVSEWLKEPLCRGNDAMSLSSTEFTWENDNSENYMALAVYTCSYFDSETKYGKTETIYEEINKRPQTGAENGFYYTWNLPNDFYAASGSYRNYTNLKFVIAGNCRVNYYNNHNHMLNVKLRYAHVQLALETNWEFSLGVDGEGVFAVNWAVNNATKYYYTSMGWDYASEF